jgi:hypothetical protein
VDVPRVAQGVGIAAWGALLWVGVRRQTSSDVRMREQAARRWKTYRRATHLWGKQHQPLQEWTVKDTQQQGAMVKWIGLPFVVLIICAGLGVALHAVIT